MCGRPSAFRLAAVNRFARLRLAAARRNLAEQVQESTAERQSLSAHRAAEPRHSQRRFTLMTITNRKASRLLTTIFLTIAVVASLALHPCSCTVSTVLAASTRYNYTDEELAMLLLRL